LKSFLTVNSRNSSITVLVICAAVFVFTVLFSGIPLNHDSALLLQCGRLVSEGSIPFVNHVETNVHMAQYIHVPAVLLSNLTGLGVPLVFTIGVVLFVLLSCFAVLVLVRKLELFHSWAGAVVVASSVLALSLRAYSTGDFGQREHLFLLAWLPFVLVRYSRMQSVGVNRALAVITGTVAGVMMLCKPTFLLQAVLVEVWMGLRIKGKGTYKTPEMFAVYFIFLALAVHLLLLPGSLQSPFFTRWIPFIAAGYHSYNASMPAIIGQFRQYWLVFLAASVVSIFVSLRSSQAIRSLIELLIAAAAVATGLFLVQHKGWPYWQAVKTSG